MREIKFLTLTVGALLVSCQLVAKDLPNFSDLAEKSSPAVVNITSTKTVSENPRSNSPYDNREFWRSKVR